jgi:hypothetical protein
VVFIDRRWRCISGWVLDIAFRTENGLVGAWVVVMGCQGKVNRADRLRFFVASGLVYACTCYY